MTTSTGAAPSPGKKLNRLGLEVVAISRQQDDALRGLRPQRDLGADHRGVLRSRRRREAGAEAVGHRLLQQEPGLLPEPVARLQLGARPHAVGRDGRAAGQPDDARHRRERRRRHGRDRHRAVRAPDAPQPAARLHHRGQRLLRSDEGPVLADRRRRLDAQERRRQRPAADRHLRDGDRAGRDVRGAVVLGRQEAAVGAAEGGAVASRHGDARRAVALRDVQRPRGLDQELQLREGSRGAAVGRELRAVLRGHLRSSTKRARRAK